MLRSFFGTLKWELMDDQKFATHAERDQQSPNISWTPIPIVCTQLSDTKAQPNSNETRRRLCLFTRRRRGRDRAACPSRKWPTL